jgi:hypothetical protein
MLWAYRVSDGEFLYGGPFEVIPLPGHAVITCAQHPDRRLQRADGAGGVRVATTQEIASYDAARSNEAELGAFDEQKMLKAVAIYFAQVAGVPLSTAKAAILTIYRGL